MKLLASMLVVLLFNAPRALADLPPLFPQGTFTVQDYLTAGGGADAHTTLAADNFGLSYYVIDNLSLGIEASGYRAWQPGENGYSYSVSGVLRHHLIDFDHATIFADVSFGPIESTLRVPAAGTYFNFATQAGIGAAYQINDNLFLLGGVRYLHISNAKLEGAARNPSLNGVQGVIGLMWKF